MNVRVRIFTEPTALPEFQDFVALNAGETILSPVREALDGFERALAEVYDDVDAPALTTIVITCDPVVEAPQGS